jgi:stage II sporulation protein AA (anti-sigma F factor antagonist)
MVDISSYTLENNVMVLVIKGEVDASSAQEMGQSLKGHLAHGHHRIIVDFSEMTFISSAGIRELFHAHREADQLGGELRIAAPTDRIRRILEISGVNMLIKISKELKGSLSNW